ncbi:MULTISPECIES: hypothetical protein [Bartonella]|uniref:hypothetical protein n=1 Tax=Bartonella TaxID=773 RepID=UPI0011A4B159|nr:MULTISPECIES: hypothetical protein [Bartonella]
MLEEIKEVKEVISFVVEEIIALIAMVKFIRGKKKYRVLGLSVMVLCAIAIGVLWYFGYSTNLLLCFAMIVCCVICVMLVVINHKNKELAEDLTQKYQECAGYKEIIAQEEKKVIQLTEDLKQKERECEIYKRIITEGERRLFNKTRKISKKWIERWDEEARQWERVVLEIKTLGENMKVSGNGPSLVKGICAQGERKLRSLYKKALEEELTNEHYEKISNKVKHFIEVDIFKQNYLKTFKLMQENGIVIEEVVNSRTKEKEYKPTILFFHWYLYVVDNMITILDREKQEKLSKERNEKQEATDSYKGNISTIIECEEIQKIATPDRSECDWLLMNKEHILSLLYDISDGYEKAIKTFIYYKMLIDTVKEGYIAFDKECNYFIIEEKIKICRENDEQREKDSSIAEETLTFEEAYKLGAREWMRSSNKKCDNRLIFWKKLVEEENSKRKLDIIFDNKGVQELEKAIGDTQRLFNFDMRTAISENKDFHYDQSCEHFIDYLR